MIGSVQGGACTWGTATPSRAGWRKDAELNRVRIIAGPRRCSATGDAATLNDVARHGRSRGATVYRGSPTRTSGRRAVRRHRRTAERVTRAGLADPTPGPGYQSAGAGVRGAGDGPRAARGHARTGGDPQRRAQMRERVGPLLDELVARAKQQGKLPPTSCPGLSHAPVDARRRHRASRPTRAVAPLPRTLIDGCEPAPTSHRSPRSGAGRAQRRP